MGFYYPIHISVHILSVRKKSTRQRANFCQTSGVWMHFTLRQKISGFPVFSKSLNSFRMWSKSTPLGGTCVALLGVMSISWYLMLLVTPMHCSIFVPIPIKSIQHLNQDKHIILDIAHREVIALAEHAGVLFYPSDEISLWVSRYRG